MMPAVDTAKAPESESQSGVGIQTEGDMTRGIKFAGQFHGPTEGRDGCVRHFYSSQHSRCRDAEVQIGQHFGCRGAIHDWQLFLWHVVHVEDRRPALDLHDIVSFLQQFNNQLFQSFPIISNSFQSFSIIFNNFQSFSIIFVICN